MKTVFVLGAGASFEVGLPIGNTLTESIASLLDIRFRHYSDLVSGDASLAEALQIHAARCVPPERDPNVYFHAARRASQAMSLAASIDTFIDAHRGDKLVELCGKLAIARAILSAERSSKLYTPIEHHADLLDQKRTKNTWFNSFWKLLTEGCTFDELYRRVDSLKFIVFNYDRCLEHFLFHAARSYYSVNFTDAAQLVNKIAIYHPYGSIGPLPWTGSANSVAYGSDANPTLLTESAKQLRTFTETADPGSNLVSEMQASVAEADRVVFLGFAFHRQNLRLLWPGPAPADSTKKFYGTAKGISPADTQVIANELGAIAAPQSQNYLHIQCNELFFELWRNLSML